MEKRFISLMVLSGSLVVSSFSFVLADVPKTSTPPLIVAPDQLPPSETPPQPTGLANLKVLADTLECIQEKNICIATGNASAVKLDSPERQTINADKLTVHFEKEKGSKKKKEEEKEKGMGSTKITLVEADGNVFMVKGPTIIQGERGTYDAKTEFAHVYDNVKITSEENQINGDHGEVDMTTGHYKVDTKEHQQVQALLFTKNKSKKEEKSTPPAANAAEKELPKDESPKTGGAE